MCDVRILDLTDERGIYGAKLLADLGADVVRPEAPDGDPLRQRGPHFEAAGAGTTSLWYAFFGSNRRFFSVDPATRDGCAQLERLALRADVVLTCDRAFGVETLDFEALAASKPELVVINTSSFGQQGPWRDYLAPDIVAGALAGAAATTGDVDTPPLKGFGELNFMVSGAYVAIAALAALSSSRATGQGQKAEVSVHECLVSCLEQVLMFYWYSERMMKPKNVLPRRGATHWSDAYTVMQAKQGSIMVTPTPDFDKQLVWLIEEGVQEDLLDPKYSEPENLPLLIERTMEILRRWVATKDAEQLFYDAQERHSPYGWVLPIERVADNPQLHARQWYQPYRIGAAQTTSPGAPYQFSDADWVLYDHHGPGFDTQGVLADIGWEGDR